MNSGLAKNISSLALAAGLPFGTLLHLPAPTETIYKHTAQGDLKLYCFESKQRMPDVKVPAVLWIHGGGWTGGTCESFFPLARYTATRGAESFVVQYRLANTNGTVTVADCVADCKSAVRYLRGHSAELGIDPERIAIIGESAGGHLAACVAVLENFDDPADDLKISARPNAVVLYNPLTDFTQSQFLRLFTNALPAEAAVKQAHALSPLMHVHSNLPPVLCIHGLADTVVSPEQSQKFALALKNNGNRCELMLLPETPHAFLIPNYKCSEQTVVNALLIGDKFLTSLGWFAGEPNLVASDPPAWQAKWPAPKNRK